MTRGMLHLTFPSHQESSLQFMGFWCSHPRNTTTPTTSKVNGSTTTEFKKSASNCGYSRDPGELLSRVGILDRQEKLAGFVVEEIVVGGVREHENSSRSTSLYVLSSPLKR